jgi:hypothetical protein
MSEERECVKKLRALVGTPPHATFIATVTKVDGAVCTVDRKTDLKEFTDVRLNVSSLEGEGIVITPKKNSDISVTTINGYDWFVSQFSEIEKITIHVDDTLDVEFGGEMNIKCSKSVKLNGDKITVETKTGDLELSSGGKISISNKITTLQKCIDEIHKLIQGIKVTTPVGPGTVDPGTIANSIVQQQLANQLLK